MHQEDFRTRSQTVRKSARLHLLDIRRARIAKRELRNFQADVVDVASVADSLALPTAQGINAVEDLPQGKQPDSNGVIPIPSLFEVPTVVTTGVALHLQHVSEVAKKPDPAAGTGHALIDDLAVQRAALAELSDDASPQRTLFFAAKFGAKDRSPPATVATTGKVMFSASLQSDIGIMAADLVIGQSDLPEHVDDGLEESAPEAKVNSTTSDGLPIAPAVQECAPAQTASDAVEALEGMTLQSDLPHVPPGTEAGNAEASDLYSLPGAGPGLIWILQQCGINTMNDLANCDSSTLTFKLGLVGQILDVDAWLCFARHGTCQRL